ncbi:MAG: carbohydrate kinase family protein [Clostridiales bacterium]|nr:carbohydrate kinase family protein [Clostridiales bacterium]
MKKPQIVGIGACVMDTLVSLPYYPEEDTKLKAFSSKLSGGGPAATGLVAASVLGSATGFIGVLSDDNGGKFLLDDFKKYFVSTDCVTVKEGCASFVAYVLLSERDATRTCILDKGNLPPLVLDEKAKRAISDANILMVDGNEMDAAVEAAEIARESGTIVLYDAGGMYENVDRLLSLTDILIPSMEYALWHTGCDNVKNAAKILYDRYHPKYVVVTCGMDGGVYFDGEIYEYYPCYKVEVVDSNGAGDVFHGAFAHGVLSGYDPMKCCFFSSAVAALKCTGIGARQSVPKKETVIKFLKENDYEL